MHDLHIRYWIVILLLTSCSGFSFSLSANPTATTVQPGDTVEAQRGSCTLSLASNISDREIIQSVLLAEGKLIVEQDIDALMALWIDESQVADAKNTPELSDDDQVWHGKDAIRHRYVRIVFPGAPSIAQPSDLQIQIEDTSALVIATTNIGTEVSPRGDLWELVKIDNCWSIKRLTYNLEPRR